MFCTNCGANQPDDGLFCTDCGHKLDMPASDPSVTTPPAEPTESVLNADSSVDKPIESLQQEGLPAEPIQGSYEAATPQEPSTQGEYAASPQPQEANAFSSNVQAQGPLARPIPSQPYDALSSTPPKKKFLFDDSEPSDGAKPPKPPKVKKERPTPGNDTGFEQIGFAQKPKNTLFLAIIGTLAALLCGAIVWLVIELGEIKSVKADIGAKDSKITELQASLNSLNASRGQDKDTIASLQATVKDLNGQIAQNKEKLNFFDTYAVIVPDDGTKYYHTYECTHYDHNAKFWIYNVLLAESEGFKPCPYCKK